MRPLCVVALLLSTACGGSSAQTTPKAGPSATTPSTGPTPSAAAAGPCAPQRTFQLAPETWSVVTKMGSSELKIPRFRVAIRPGSGEQRRWFEEAGELAGYTPGNVLVEAGAPAPIFKASYAGSNDSVTAERRGSSLVFVHHEEDVSAHGPETELAFPLTGDGTVCVVLLPSAAVSP